MSQCEVIAVVQRPPVFSWENPVPRAVQALLNQRGVWVTEVPVPGGPLTHWWPRRVRGCGVACGPWAGDFTSTWPHHCPRLHKPSDVSVCREAPAGGLNTGVQILPQKGTNGAK